MKFMMTKIVYGTDCVSSHQGHGMDVNIRNINKQLKSHNFVFKRGLRLPPTIYCAGVR
jgi:hypothetical protein